MSASLVGSEDVYKRQARLLLAFLRARGAALSQQECAALGAQIHLGVQNACLLYTSDAADDM
eukprot:10291062-Alexandrium_andersonii.AAC.1